MNKTLLFLLMLLCFSFATSELEMEVERWSDTLAGLVIPLAIVLTVVAAAAYMGGQLFGAETRARANVYASNLLTAAGIAIVVLVVFELLLPVFTGGAIGGFGVDIARIIDIMKEFAESFLIVLIMLLVVLAAVIFMFGKMTDSQTRSRANVWATGMITGAVIASIIYLLITAIVPGLGSIIAGLPFQGLAIYPIVVISVVLLVSFVILITYLLSKVFKIPEWEAYLSVELSQLMNSFLVMIFIVAAFATAQGVTMSMTGTTGGSPPLAAAQFLREWVAESVLSGLFDVLTIQACTSMLSTISRRMGEAVMTNVYKVFPGMDTFVSISNTLLFGFMSAYGSISVQVMILNFIEVITVPILFPAGLFLRFFPPTRDAGSFLIAMAFSFQIVFPATFLIHEMVLEDLNVEKYNSPTALIASICGPFKYGVAGFLFGSGNPLFSGPLAPLGRFLGAIASETLLNLISMAEFIPIMRTVSLLSLLSLFMPGLSTVITIAFINGLSKFLVAKM